MTSKRFQQNMRTSLRKYWCHVLFCITRNEVWNVTNTGCKDKGKSRKGLLDEKEMLNKNKIRSTKLLIFQCVGLRRGSMMRWIMSQKRELKHLKMTMVKKISVRSRRRQKTININLKNWTESKLYL